MSPLGFRSITQKLHLKIIRWAHPDWNRPTTRADDPSWPQRHAELSTTIWKLTSLLVLASLFCVFVLGAPDATLVSSDSKISVPIASITMSYSDFLFLAPLFLIGLAVYMHVFIGQLLRMKSFNQLQLSAVSAHIFNLDSAWARGLSSFLFYGMLPAVLFFFFWKAIPRPYAGWRLGCLFFLVSAMMLLLKLRRFDVEVRLRSSIWAAWSRRLLWALLIVSIVNFLYFAGIAGRTFFSNAAVSGVPLFRLRRLELFGASLNNKNLSGFYGRYADLRKADLTGADLEGADLSYADLRKANLSGANLVKTNLTHARLEGSNLENAKLELTLLQNASVDDDTKISSKWARVICIVSHASYRDCPQFTDLAWMDLSAADLRGASFRNAEMTGADLHSADLSLSDLTGAVLRLADLRHSNLPDSISQANTTGAVMPNGSSPSGGNPGVKVWLANWGNEGCLELPAEPRNGSRPVIYSPCVAASDNIHSFLIKRLANGYLSLRTSYRDLFSCIDGSTYTENAAIQMWQCGDNYENQYWHITKAEKDFVSIERYRTGFCIDGTASHDGRPVPIQTKCNGENHDQQWIISFGPITGVPGSDPKASDVFRQRVEDFDNVSTRYAVNPWAEGYGREFRLRPYGSLEPYRSQRFPYNRSGR